MNAIVKSAQRVMELFEYYAEHKAPASIKDLCIALGYPQSSTSALVYSLVQLGYLSHDPHLRTFRPTLRIVTVGSWVLNDLPEDIDPFRIMDDLSNETGHTIVLGMQRDTQVLYVRVVDATNPLRFSMRAGTLRPMCETAVGHALLSALPDNKIRPLVNRINAEQEEGQRQISASKLLKTINEARRKGYAMTVNVATPGAAVIAKLLPLPPGQPLLAIGIGMPSCDAIDNEVQIADLLHHKMLAAHTSCDD